MELATNASVMRASNRRLILDLIRLGPISRVELSDKTRLTRASVTQIVEELIESGLVEETAAEERSSLGRRRIRLALCHRTRFVFGVNLRRRHCRVGVTDLYGEVLAEQELPAGEVPPAETMDLIADVIGEQKRKLRLKTEQIIGIGLSSPGPVDHREGVILNPPNFPLWQNVPARSMLKERTGLDCFVEKDTNARALEEKYFGAARDVSNFMLLQVDDGVGSGIMIRDRLYRGFRGTGTEIGHTSIRFDGPVCPCGNRGCLENYLRIPSLLKGTPFADWHALCERSDTEAAHVVLEQAAEYLTPALVNAFNLFDLERVIVTGDVSERPELLSSLLEEHVRGRILSSQHRPETPVIVTRSDMPARTGVMAALRTVFSDV